MTNVECLMIISIIIAPVLAVQVQKWLEKWNENSVRKKKIFETLMTTRATPVDPTHVAALNMIDFVFIKEESICEKWREYFDCLHDAPQAPKMEDAEELQTVYAQDMKTWNARKDDKFIDLLYEMSKILKYKFNKVHLKKGIYYPIGHAEREAEDRILRQAAASFFSGKHSVAMNVTSFPTPDEENEVVKMQAKIRKYILNLMEDKAIIPILLRSTEEIKKPE